MTTPSKRPATRVLEAIMSEQWAITKQGLHQVVAIAERAHDPEAFRAVLADRGEPLRDTERTEVRDGVAVVPIIGPIFRYANLFTQISGATSIDMLAHDFGAAVRNPAVDAIVLEIDSPGGMVAGVSEFAEMVRAAQAEKPVVAYVSNLGASAAYWIASAAGQLVVRDTAQVGSIGVVMQVMRDGADGAIKFRSSQSPLKQVSADTEAGQRDYQARVDALAAVFVEAVADYRGVSVDTVLEGFGQGTVLVGRGAVAAGMADRMGSLESVIAGLTGSQPQRSPRMSDKPNAPVITVAYIADEHPAIADHFRQEGVNSVPAMTLELVREKHPEIAAALLAEGASAECKRIQAVEEQFAGFPGHEALLAKLKADGKTSGPEAAMAVNAAERKVREGHRDDILEDGKELDGKAPAAAAPTGKVDRSHLPLEERCKAEWDESAELRAEFGDRFESYLSFQRAEAAGRVRFSSANR